MQAFTGTLAHERIEVEDAAVAALRFENGALGVIEGTTAAYPGMFKKPKSAVRKALLYWKKRTS